MLYQSFFINVCQFLVYLSAWVIIILCFSSYLYCPLWYSSIEHVVIFCSLLQFSEIWGPGWRRGCTCREIQETLWWSYIWFPQSWGWDTMIHHVRIIKIFLKRWFWYVCSEDEVLYYLVLFLSQPCTISIIDPQLILKGAVWRGSPGLATFLLTAIAENGTLGIFNWNPKGQSVKWNLLFELVRHPISM